VCRFNVGRSGSFGEELSLEVVDAVSVPELPEPELPEEDPSELRRFIVGRSGSSAEELPLCDVLPLCVDEAVVVEASPPEPELELSLRRFIVGRSGSSAGAVVLLALDPEFEAVVPEVEFVDPEVEFVDVLDGSLRFIVGRSGSLLADVLELFPESALLSVVVDAGLLWSVPLEDVASPAGLLLKCGLFGSPEVTSTGSVFDGFRVDTVFFGAASGLTSP
jgi:hypothetical protein